MISLSLLCSFADKKIKVKIWDPSCKPVPLIIKPLLQSYMKFVDIMGLDIYVSGGRPIPFEDQ